MAFVSLLFMLAVIVIGIAMLPQALAVLAGVLPWLVPIVVVVGVISIVGRVIGWGLEELAGVRFFPSTRDRLRDHLGPHWGLLTFLLLWGAFWTAGTIVGFFTGTWESNPERIRFTTFAGLLGIVTLGLPLWLFSAHRRGRVGRRGRP